MNELSYITRLNFTTVSNMYITHPCLECTHMSEYKDSLDKAMEIPLDVDPGRKVLSEYEELNKYMHIDIGWGLQFAMHYDLNVDPGYKRECRQLSTPECYGDYWNQGNECIMCESAMNCINAWNRRSKHA